MNFVQVYREDIDIWKQNPFLRKIEPYKRIVKEDRNGMIMLSLFMIFDVKSPIYTKITNEAERIQDVTETFLPEGFKWDKYKDLIEAYKKDCRTETQKQLDQLRQDIDERERFARALSYDDEENRGLKMDMLDSQPRYIEMYKELEDKVREEVADLESLGGYRKSYLEELGLELSEKYPDAN